MANLLENYKGRLSISEKYYAARHNGQRMPMKEKMLTAAMLSNTAKFMNEAFANQVGTQRADMGKFKQFCMDITTLTMPNLIVNQIFMVKEMSSIVGWLTYTAYSLGTTKGAVGGKTNDAPYGAAIDGYPGRRDGGTAGTWNTPVNDFRNGLGKVTADRVNYTGKFVVDVVDGIPTNKIYTPVWAPIVKDTIKFLNKDNIVLTPTGTVDINDDKIDFTNVTAFTAASGTDTTLAKIAYVYDNEYIPAAVLPTIVAHQEGIALKAEPRRIAVYYDMLAAYQAKTDYGIDLESQIAQQAQAELQFEIDNEAVIKLRDVALYGATDAQNNPIDSEQVLDWVDQDPQAVSYSMQAEGFAKKLEEAKMVVYKRTNRFIPNYMICSPDVLPILNFVPGFKAADATIANGPFLAGTVANLKVFVSPALTEDTGVCILGVLGADGKTATGVFAPYMPIVPTQLIQMADGGNSQGFATMYDMKVLNTNLMAVIRITKGAKELEVKVTNAAEFPTTGG